MKLQIKDARIAFAQVFTPKSFTEGQTPMYSGTIIIPKDHPQIQEIATAEREVMAAKWGKKAEDEGFRKRLARRPLRNGADKDHYAGFDDTVYFMGCNSKIRPTVVGRDRAPLTEADGVIYSGCYVNAIVTMWAQDNQFGKAVNCALDGIQFVKDGENFAGGSGAAKAEDFDDLEGTAQPASTNGASAPTVDPLA